MLSKFLGCKVLLFATVTLTSAFTRADYVSSSGTACRESPRTTNADYFLYLRNTSMTTSISVSCPLNVGQMSWAWNGVNQAIVRYVSYPATATSFSCKIVRTYFDGTITPSDPVYACSTPGGCLSPDPYYRGTGYLAIGVPGAVIAADIPLTLECTVPSRSNDGYSGIVSYYLQ